MNATLKITRIGNSVGVILPRDMLAHLGVAVGETVLVVTTPRGIELAAADGEFEAQMAAAREVMARRKRALRELAKLRGAHPAATSAACGDASLAPLPLAGGAGGGPVTGDSRCITNEVAEAAHREQLAEHGGGEGMRDAGALESAMARPRQRAAYKDCDAPTLAAAYAFGIACNHPFVDGNRRTAAVVSEAFLVLNGWRFTANDAQLVVGFIALAAGDLSEAELAQWFRDHAEPTSSSPRA